MTFPFRHLAPAGSPVTTGDLVRWCGSAYSGTAAAVALKQAIRDRFGVRHVSLTSTGRAGLTLLLRAMRRLSDGKRDEVVLPSYTCYSLPAAVMKAGLRPRIVDISRETLDYAPEALEQTDFSRVLAIVASNLYGLPNDLPALERIARQHGAFLIDDAAQALGARVAGKWSGTWGDAGLFSFDKGKNVSAIDGGIVVTNSDVLAAAFEEETADLEIPGPATSAIHILKALAYFAMLRPWLYWIPARIPQLGLGRTIYTTEYALAQPDRVLVALGLTMLRRLDEFTRARHINAESLTRELRAIGLRTIAPRPDTAPAYLRLPVLLAGPREQSAAIEALKANGIGATSSYPASIADLPELQGSIAGGPAMAGRDVARRIVTLPTHPFVTTADIRRIRVTLEGRATAVAPAKAFTA